MEVEEIPNSNKEEQLEERGEIEKKNIQVGEEVIKEEEENDEEEENKEEDEDQDQTFRETSPDGTQVTLNPRYSLTCHQNFIPVLGPYRDLIWKSFPLGTINAIFGSLRTL